MTGLYTALQETVVNQVRDFAISKIPQLVSPSLKEGAQGTVASSAAIFALYRFAHYWNQRISRAVEAVGTDVGRTTGYFMPMVPPIINIAAGILMFRQSANGVIKACGALLGAAGAARLIATAIFAEMLLRNRAVERDRLNDIRIQTEEVNALTALIEACNARNEALNRYNRASEPPPRNRLIAFIIGIVRRNPLNK